MNHVIAGFEKRAKGGLKKRFTDWYQGKVPGGTWTQKYDALANSPMHRTSKALGKTLIGTGLTAAALYGADQLLRPTKTRATRQFQTPVTYT